MTPQTVNAVNLPILNALNFPAGILQPPFFDPKASAAINYGGIGADDRPRDQPQLRRHRRAVRRRRSPAQLVDRRRPEAVPRPPAPRSRRSSTATSRSPTSA